MKKIWLIAQGRTVAETLEIARDVAKKLIEAQNSQPNELPAFSDSFDLRWKPVTETMIKSV